MNQQEKMKIAKSLTLDRLRAAFEDFEQVGDYSFASLEEVNGEEWWTITTIQAKKKFDIDAAVEDYEFSHEQAKEKEAKKKKKKENRSEKPTK